VCGDDSERMNGERRYFVADNGWFEFEVKLCTAMIGIL
jgi:hypothetical protein